MIPYSPQLYNELHMGLTSLYVTATSSTDVEFLKEDFVQTGNSFVTATDSPSIPIGIAVQRTMTLTVLNKSGKFNEFEFKNAVLTIYINGDLTTGETDTIKIGRFTVINAKANNSIITLSLVDDMIKTEKEFSTNLSFPVTAGDLLADCCNSCGISLGDIEFQNSDTTLYTKPQKGTFREVIANIALIACGVAVFDGDNELRIKSPNIDILKERFYLLEKPYYVGGGSKQYRWYHQGETFTNYDTLDYDLIRTTTKVGNWRPDVVYNYSGQDIPIDSVVLKVHLEDMSDVMHPLTNVSGYDYYGTLSFIIDNQSYSFIIKNQSNYFNPTSNILQPDNKIYPNDMNTNTGILQDVYYRRVYEGAEHIGEFYISFAYSFYNKIQDRLIESLEIKSKVLLSSAAYSFEGSGYEVAGSFTKDETDSYDGGLFTDSISLLNLSDNIKLTYEKEGVLGCRTAITCTGSKFSGTRYYGQIESYTSSLRLTALPVDISKCLFLETNSDNWTDRTTGLNEIDSIGNAIGSIISGVYSAKPQFTFYPFSATATMNPFAEICDIGYFEDEGNLRRTFISDIDFVFGGVTTFSNDTKIQNETRISSSSSVISVASSIRNSDRNIQPYETQVEQLNNLANNALPYYITKEVSGNSIITYYHNNSTLSSSTVVYKICKEGIFLSHDGGTTWISGFDQDGNAVIYTASIGQLLASKLTVLNDAYIKNHSSPIGTIKSNRSSSSTASLSSTTSMTKIADLTTLEPGVWVINARIQFPSNSTGNRGGAIYSNGTQQGTSYILLPAGGSIISQSMSAIVNSTSNMDIDLYARQNSGSDMNITYYWKAVRIQ